jgi:hypothetical protein
MSAAIAFLFLSKPNQVPIFISTTSSNEAIWKQYEEYYCQIDPWNAILTSSEYQENTIQYGRKHLAEKGFKKTEYYNDFWKAFELGETIGGLLSTQSGITIQIGIPKAINTKN